MLQMTWEEGETIIIDDGIEITVTDIQGDHVKIGIDEAKEENVFREELRERVSD
jgi:carbon storage regulator